jgi:membrane protease YdiL (CAAX protease family)
VTLLMPFAAEAESWAPRDWWLRMLAAVLVVPLFEEQLMRGFMLRFGTQWSTAKKRGAEDPFGEAFDKESVHDLAPGKVSAFGAVLSIALFTAGHHFIEWPASIVYGGLMVWLYAWRKDLLSCVTAHAVTNLLLALWVRGTDAWGLW